MTYLDYVMQLPKVIGEGLSREEVRENYCPRDFVKGHSCNYLTFTCRGCWELEMPELKEEELMATKTTKIPGDDNMLKSTIDGRVVTYPSAFAAIANELTALYQRKNHDYGNSFADTWKKLGPVSGITRISDKFNRLCNLMTTKDKQQVKDESIDDTLSDLACYSIMAMIELRRERGEYDL